MNSYLIPANSKKGTLIFNIFTPFDLILFGIGVGISFLLLALFSGGASTLVTILICMPAAITGLLVIPIPNYHNVLTAIRSMIDYFFGRRRYIWKGWCIYERIVKELENEQKAAKK